MNCVGIGSTLVGGDCNPNTILILNVLNEGYLTGLLVIEKVNVEVEEANTIRSTGLVGVAINRNVEAGKCIVIGVLELNNNVVVVYVINCAACEIANYDIGSIDDKGLVK